MLGCTCVVSLFAGGQHMGVNLCCRFGHHCCVDLMNCVDLRVNLGNHYSECVVRSMFFKSPYSKFVCFIQC